MRTIFWMATFHFLAKSLPLGIVSMCKIHCTTEFPSENEAYKSKIGCHFGVRRLNFNSPAVT